MCAISPPGISDGPPDRHWAGAVSAACENASIRPGWISLNNSSTPNARRSSDNKQSEKAAVPLAPPTPEWVNPDGTVDESKMLEEMPLMGPDG